MDSMMNVPRERTTAGERIADALHVDGNAVAGILSEVFVPDLTAARTICAHCGATRPMGALLVYAHGMGMVVRCPDCDGVLLRIARTPAHLWLSMTGVTSIVTDMAALSA